MKITAVYGSPAKAGNSAVLADTILKSAEGIGHTCERFYLHDLLQRAEEIGRKIN